MYIHVKPSCYTCEKWYNVKRGKINKKQQIDDAWEIRLYDEWQVFFHFLVHIDMTISFISIFQQIEKLVTISITFIMKLIVVHYFSNKYILNLHKGAI